MIRQKGTKPRHTEIGSPVVDALVSWADKYVHVYKNVPADRNYTCLEICNPNLCWNHLVECSVETVMVLHFKCSGVLMRGEKSS